MEEIIKILWRASTERLACRVTLEGEPFPRVVHPYGVCQTSGKLLVLVCIQVSGYTKSGGHEGFRNLQLVKVGEVEILDQKFEANSDFDPKDSQYGEWVYHL